MIYVVIAFAAVTVGVLLYLIVNTPIFTVEEGQAVIIQRLGKFKKVLGPGMHFMWPFIERKRKFMEDGIERDFIDQRERTVDLPAQSVITKDKVQLDVDSVAYYQISEPEKAVYNVDDVVVAINQLIRTILRDVIGDTDLEKLLSGRKAINEKLKDEVTRASEDWGIHIRRVELQEVSPPASYAEAMRRVSEAELARTAAITEAEGRKQAAILEADGDAEKIKRVYKAIHDGKPNKELLRIKYLEALEKIADGNATKVFMPFPSSPDVEGSDFDLKQGAGSGFNQAIGMAAGFDAYASDTQNATPAKSESPPPAQPNPEPANQTTTPISDAERPKKRRVVRRVKKKPSSTPPSTPE